jgi:glutamate/tyrosine decarboxylase-like PLP-dependent enzyme
MNPKGIDPHERQPLASYFLGPKAQNASLWQELIERIFDDYVHWRRNYFPEDKSFITRGERRDFEQLAWLDELSEQLDRILDKLKSDFPFYSPRYFAHMNSEVTLPSVLGLFAGVLYNPNNVSPEGAPVTIKLEIEVGELLAQMLGFDRNEEHPAGAPWGHLTSGGTIANLEALWVARQAQFLPLVVADLCEQPARRTKVLEALKRRGVSTSGADACLRDSGVWGVFNKRFGSRAVRADLLRRPSGEQLSLLRELHDALLADLGGDDRQRPGAVVSSFLMEAVEGSPFNPASAGYPAALAELNCTADKGLRRGVVFASEAAHYSLKKACNVLGYGRDGLQLIQVDKDFRVDVEQLEAATEEVERQGGYVAAVVAIAGTTEEGAVDPVHDIVTLREQKPFWLHVDAAWGGYVATVFDRNEEGQLIRDGGAFGPAMVSGGEGLAGLPPVSRQADATAGEALNWGAGGGPQEKVLQAFGAIGSCDSAVVDPHKLGYVPYPAGAIVFRHGGTRLLTAQAASYMGSAGKLEDDPLSENALAEPATVGEYVLEGSKPGAAATAVWLAHQTIPLTRKGHGRIVSETLLAAQRLAAALTLFNSDPARHSNAGCPSIGFYLVTEPQTNVVTFVARPLRKVGSGDSAKLDAVHWSLADLNTINRRIHERMKAANLPQGAGRTSSEPVPPYRHPFFVSRTCMESDQQPSGTYSFRSVEPMLAALLPRESDHRLEFDRNSEGLFTIRCVVMNPYYRLSQEHGDDHMAAFVARLHAVGCEILTQFMEELSAVILIRCEAGKATSVKEELDKDGGGSSRRTMVVTDDSGAEAVLVEARDSTEEEVNPRERVRQLVAEHTAVGIEGAETFIGSGRRHRGRIDSEAPPVSYVLMATEVGCETEVLERSVGVRLPNGAGIEGRLVAGRYDVALRLSSLDHAAASAVLEQITSVEGVIRDEIEIYSVIS